MNSCLSYNHVIHARMLPKSYKFGFSFFWFHIDLDEIEDVCKSNPFISYNKFNLYSLYDRDHWYSPGLSLKENVLQYLSQQGLNIDVAKIVLVTSLRFLNYVFNPVSYYFITATDGQKYCLIEICNTFKELKPILVVEPAENGVYKIKTQKNFYVSPYTQMNEMMEFIIHEYSEKLTINVKTFNQDRVEVLTSLTGHTAPLTTLELLKATLRFPFQTLRVILAIHFHALMLFLKGFHYKKKSDDLEHQKGYVSWRQ
jgi:uncharacterized protein